MAAARYRGKLSLRGVAHEIGGETEKRFHSLLGRRDFEIPVEAWIARDGLPRRIKVSVNVEGASVQLDFQIARYGVRVPADPPPAAQVIEEPDWDAYTQANHRSS